MGVCLSRGGDGQQQGENRLISYIRRKFVDNPPKKKPTVWRLHTPSPVPDWVDDLDSQGERILAYNRKFSSAQIQSTVPASSRDSSIGDGTDLETPSDLIFRSDTDMALASTVVEQFPGASEAGSDDELIIERTRFPPGSDKESPPAQARSPVLDILPPAAPHTLHAREYTADNVPPLITRSTRASHDRISVAETAYSRPPRSTLTPITPTLTEHKIGINQMVPPQSHPLMTDERVYAANDKYAVISKEPMVITTAEAMMTPTSHLGPEKKAKGILPPLGKVSARLPPLNILPPISALPKIAQSLEKTAEDSNQDAASAQMERKEVFTPYELASDVGVVVHASGLQLVVDCAQPTEAVTRTITSSIHHLEEVPKMEPAQETEDDEGSYVPLTNSSVSLSGHISAAVNETFPVHSPVLTEGITVPSPINIPEQQMIVCKSNEDVVREGIPSAQQGSGDQTSEAEAESSIQTNDPAPQQVITEAKPELQAEPEAQSASSEQDISDEACTGEQGDSQTSPTIFIGTAPEKEAVLSASPTIFIGTAPEKEAVPSAEKKSADEVKPEDRMPAMESEAMAEADPTDACTESEPEIEASHLDAESAPVLEVKDIQDVPAADISMLEDSQTSTQACTDSQSPPSPQPTATIDTAGSDTCAQEEPRISPEAFSDAENVPLAEQEITEKERSEDKMPAMESEADPRDACSEIEPETENALVDEETASVPEVKDAQDLPVADTSMLEDSQTSPQPAATIDTAGSDTCVDEEPQSFSEAIIEAAAKITSQTYLTTQEDSDIKASAVAEEDTTEHTLDEEQACFEKEIEKVEKQIAETSSNSPASFEEEGDPTRKTTNTEQQSLSEACVSPSLEMSADQDEMAAACDDPILGAEPETITSSFPKADGIFGLNKASEPPTLSAFAAGELKERTDALAEMLSSAISPRSQQDCNALVSDSETENADYVEETAKEASLAVEPTSPEIETLYDAEADSAEPDCNMEEHLPAVKSISAQNESPFETEALTETTAVFQERLGEQTPKDGSECDEASQDLQETLELKASSPTPAAYRDTVEDQSVTAGTCSPAASQLTPREEETADSERMVQEGCPSYEPVFGMQSRLPEADLETAAESQVKEAGHYGQLTSPEAYAIALDGIPASESSENYETKEAAPEMDEDSVPFVQEEQAIEASVDAKIEPVSEADVTTPVSPLPEAGSIQADMEATSDVEMDDNRPGSSASQDKSELVASGDAKSAETSLGPTDLECAEADTAATNEELPVDEDSPVESGACIPVETEICSGDETQEGYKESLGPKNGVQDSVEDYVQTCQVESDVGVDLNLSKSGEQLLFTSTKSGTKLIDEKPNEDSGSSIQLESDTESEQSDAGKPGSVTGPTNEGEALSVLKHFNRGLIEELHQNVPANTPRTDVSISKTGVSPEPELNLESELPDPSTEQTPDDTTDLHLVNPNEDKIDPPLAAKLDNDTVTMDEATTDNTAMPVAEPTNESNGKESHQLDVSPSPILHRHFSIQDEYDDDSAIEEILTIVTASDARSPDDYDRENQACSAPAAEQPQERATTAMRKQAARMGAEHAQESSDVSLTRAFRKENVE